MRFFGSYCDFVTYREVMGYPYNTLLTFFYLKEPIYWLGSSYLYKSFIHDKTTVFIIFDFISFLFLYKAKNNFNLKSYFILLFLASFVSVMGFNNVYRQYLATCVLLCSISYCYIGKNKKSLIIYIISLLIHNCTLLFVPIILYPYIKKNFRFSFFVLITLVMIFVLPKIMKFASISNQGLSLTPIYIAINLLIFFFVYLNKSKLSSYIFYVSFYNLIIISICFLFFGSEQAKRIGMITLSIDLPILMISLYRVISNKFFIKILLISSFILPTFFFHSSMLVFQ